MEQFLYDCSNNRKDYCCNNSDKELFGRRYKEYNPNKNGFITKVKGANIYLKKLKNKTRRNRKNKSRKSKKF